MKIRSKVNFNIVDLPDGEAQPLVDAGIFEKVEGEPSEEAVETKADRKYKRRDLKAED